MKRKLEKSEVSSQALNRVYSELIPRAQGLVDGPYPLCEWDDGDSPGIREFLKGFPRTEVWGLEGQPVLWVRL